MTETIDPTISGQKEVALPVQAETRGNAKIRLITAAALGATAIAGGLGEYYGVFKGWDIPFDYSLKHPMLGYYSAWAVSKTKHHRTAKILAAGLAADAAAETGQDLALSPDHSLHWTHFEANQHAVHGETNIDNLQDAMACMAASILFLAQNGNAFDWLKQRASNLLQSGSNEMA